MMDETLSDDQEVHRSFAPRCFNRTWELLDELGDNPSEDEADAAVLTAAASMWHWTQREDVTEKNLSVGAWLLSRVHAVAGRSEEAVYWADRSLQLAEKAGSEPFYLGYAYEALARAYGPSDADRAQQYLEVARDQAASVDDAELRELLEQDLQNVA